MRPTDQNTLNALSGSRSGDSLTVWVWYGGKLALPDPLTISSAKFAWDASRQIQTLSVSVENNDGDLTPWLLEDPLGAGGSRLQVVYNVGGAGSIQIGWYRITRPNPDESWVTYVINEPGTTTPDTPIPKDMVLAHTVGGASIQIYAEDLATIIAKAKFVAPESPQGISPTIVGEVRRLVGDICPVVTVTGVVDRPVNTSLVYQGDRLNAVQDLCKRINCDYRLNGAGQLEIFPLTPQTPVCVLKGGPEGLLVKVDRAQAYEGLYNEFWATGQATYTNTAGAQVQVAIRGYAAITQGPLRVTGDHGRYPTEYSSTMLTTQAECDAYAATMRDTQLAGLTVDLVATCAPQPQLQEGDWVTVFNAVVDGSVIALNGRAKTISMGFTNGAPDLMNVTVECTYADVQAAFSGSSNLSLAGAVTRTGLVKRTPLTPSLTLTPAPSLRAAG